ncbi:8886_t:CDS:1, partial [Scutellospora calospora]
PTKLPKTLDNNEKNDTLLENEYLLDSVSSEDQSHEKQSDNEDSKKKNVNL